MRHKKRIAGELIIPAERGIALPGDLFIAEGSKGVIVFSHGSGSSRFSPRNRYVAGVLQRHAWSTLLTDLLTPEEDALYETRFDIGLLTRRLISVCGFLEEYGDVLGTYTGLFGASTGAASALSAAVQLGNRIFAVVSRGGRPDLVMDQLPLVKSPVLLLVGERDEQVLELNRLALRALTCEKRLEVIPSATHLFEEPGTLEKAASLATAWFNAHCAQKNPSDVF